MTLKRLKKEFERILKDHSDAFTAQPLEDENLFEWVGTINGPKDSPFEAGVFSLNIVLPYDYPFNPPKVKFSTPVYHPNVSRSGSISLDILRDAWAPAITIEDVLLGIRSLLANPNPDDPMAPDIAKLYVTDREMYNRNAADWTKKYAI